MSGSSDNVVLRVRCNGGVQTNVLVNRISGTRDSREGIVLTLQNGFYSLDQIWLNEEDGFQVLRGAE
jgi:hypothetical protein